MKHLSPQELIDLRGYGQAEKHLRATGRWELTAKEEAISALSKAANACDNAITALENEEPK